MTQTRNGLLVRSGVVAAGYDLLNRALWLPRGSDQLRRQLVRAAQVDAGMRVLELGCGTGLVTRHLTAAGADVVAIDASAAMLARARDRAPGARFELADIEEFQRTTEQTYDRAVLSFVLHELDPERRVRVLRACAASLATDGLIAILEWGVPQAPFKAALWRAAIGVIEPPVAHDVVAGGLDAALDRAALTTRADEPVAGGRARIVVAVDSIRDAATPVEPVTPGAGAR